MFELDFEHVGPGALGSQVVRERIVAEWPGVPFTPEAIHKGVNTLDERIAIDFGLELTVDRMPEEFAGRAIPGLAKLIGALPMAMPSR